MQIESIQRQPQTQHQEEQQLKRNKNVQKGEEEPQEDGVLLTTFLTRTKCTKMTDESDLIKNGINGASSATSIATSNNNNNDNNHSNNNNSSNDRRNNSTTLKSEKTFGNNNDATGRTTTDGVITSAAATATGTTILTTVVNTRNGRGKCDLPPPSISNETDNRSRTPSTSNTPWTAASEALVTSSLTPSISPSNMMVSVSSNSNNNNILSIPKSNTSNLDTHSSVQSGIGGRLQFFKDGKFILELARTKDGEKEGWVSVPRKTFWPLSTNTIIYPKNESSASLISDDNSSVQSSPWQRDHCWKQTTPRKNISKEMCMYFKRTRKLILSTSGCRTSLIKRRRPYDNSVCKKPFSLPNGIKQKLPEEDEEEHQENNTADGNDIVDGNHREMDVDKTEGKVINRINGNSKRFSKSISNRAKLTSVIQKLIDRLPSSLLYSSKTSIGSGVHPISPYGSSRLTDLHHHPQQHVSPRKRILRELEKVSLEDNTNKRCRAKSSTIFSPSSVSQSTFPHGSGGGTSSSLPSTSLSSTLSHAVTSNPMNLNSSMSRGNQHIYNGNSATNEQASGSSRLNSSYSIHSLLGNAINNSSNNNSKTESSTNQNLKDINDPSYLRNMLSKSSEISSIHQFSKSSSSAFTNNFKKSPNYSPHHEGHSRTRSPSTECENSLSGSRLKTLNASPNAASSFHPYIPSSSPKYSSNLLHSSSLNDSYKIRSGSGRRSTSPSTQQHLLTSHHGSSVSNDRSPPLSTLPHSPQSLRYSSRASPPINNSIISPNANNSNHIRSNKELSPAGDNLSSRLEQRREGTPRTVPKKTAALRQQFSSPTSISPSTSQQGEISIPASINYSSSSNDHSMKKRNLDELSSLSPADKQRSSNSPSSSSLSSPYHHAQLDLDHGINNVLRSSVISPSAAALYYMGYPRHGSPVTAHASTTPYIPPVSYYHPYAAAVAALRNPLWMHYQAAAAATAAAGVLPPAGTTSSRVSSAVSFPYNGASPGQPPSPLQTPFAPSMHLSPSIGSMKSWQPPSPQNLTTEDPVSLAIKKDEPSSDTPLNLSKH